MPSRIEVAGNRYGRFVVLGDAANEGRERHVLVRCDCGAEKSVRLSNLRSGRVVSCGCHLADKNRSRSTHGHARRGSISAEYVAWQEIRRRCLSRTHHAYPRYGGRGISICERWLLFENFLADMGARPSSGHSIDRINVNGNYEPGNCRWATDLEQGNNRRITQMVEYQGRTQSISMWARELGVKYFSLRNRIITLGWPIEKAMTAPYVLGRNQFD